MDDADPLTHDAAGVSPPLIDPLGASRRDNLGVPLVQGPLPITLSPLGDVVFLDRRSSVRDLEEGLNDFPPRTPHACQLARHTEGTVKIPDDSTNGGWGSICRRQLGLLRQSEEAIQTFTAPGLVDGGLLSHSLGCFHNGLRRFPL
jgi:hypothetical protein